MLKTLNIQGHCIFIYHISILASLLWKTNPLIHFHFLFTFQFCQWYKSYIFKVGNIFIQFCNYSSHDYLVLFLYLSCHIEQNSFFFVFLIRKLFLFNCFWPEFTDKNYLFFLVPSLFIFKDVSLCLYAWWAWQNIKFLLNNYFPQIWERNTAALFVQLCLKQLGL